MNPPLRRKRFLMLSATALLVAFVVLLYLLGSVLITILFSALIAYVLLPLANLITRLMPWRDSRPGLSRGIAVGLIFIIAAGIFVGLMALVIPQTIEQGKQLIDELPVFFTSARITVEGWIDEYSELVSPDVRVQIEDRLEEMAVVLANAAWQIAPRTFGLVSSTFSLIIGLATMPVLIFYMVKDSSQIGTSLLKPFPGPLRPYLLDVVKIADRTLGGYLRGQMILGLTIGISVTVGLLVIGVPYAVVLGVVAGITELIPIVGPLIGAAVAILVTLATAPEKLLWVAVLYLGVQVIENTLLVPRVQADTLNIHPIVVIIVIIVGGHFFGIWGIILGPPLVSMGKDIVKYLAQEWDQPPNSLAENTSHGEPQPDSEPTEQSN